MEIILQKTFGTKCKTIRRLTRGGVVRLGPGCIAGILGPILGVTMLVWLPNGSPGKLDIGLDIGPSETFEVQELYFEFRNQ